MKTMDSVEKMPMKKDKSISEEAMGGVGKMTLNMKDHPQLQGVQEGQEIEGSFECRVVGVNGDQVDLEYTNIDFSTENQADQSLKKMMGKPVGNSDQKEEETEY